MRSRQRRMATVLRSVQLLLDMQLPRSWLLVARAVADTKESEVLTVPAALYTNNTCSKLKGCFTITITKACSVRALVTVLAPVA